MFIKLTLLSNIPFICPQASVAMYFDAMNVTNRALEDAANTSPLKSKSTTCGQDDDQWEYGLTLANLLKTDVSITTAYFAQK